MSLLSGIPQGSCIIIFPSVYLKNKLVNLINYVILTDQYPMTIGLR